MINLKLYVYHGIFQFCKNIFIAYLNIACIHQQKSFFILLPVVPSSVGD